MMDSDLRAIQILSQQIVDCMEKTISHLYTKDEYENDPEKVNTLILSALISTLTNFIAYKGDMSHDEACKALSTTLRNGPPETFTFQPN
jgi:hypothetical protein